MINKKYRKDNKGITLVALVVTIVVLLILAGITLTYLMGDNNIIKKAQDAKNRTVEAIENEQDYFNNINNTINNYINGENGDGEKPSEGTSTDPKYFTFELNTDTKTATITGIKKEYALRSYYGDSVQNICIIDGDTEITDIVVPSTITEGRSRF